MAESLARPASGSPDAPPVEVVDPFTVRGVDGEAGAIRYALQPLSDDETVIHAALVEAPPASERIAVLRRENDRLRTVRDAIEAEQSP